MVILPCSDCQELRRKFTVEPSLRRSKGRDGCQEGREIWNPMGLMMFDVFATCCLWWQIVPKRVFCVARKARDKSDVWVLKSNNLFMVFRFFIYLYFVLCVCFLETIDANCSCFVSFKLLKMIVWRKCQHLFPGSFGGPRCSCGGLHRGTRGLRNTQRPTARSAAAAGAGGVARLWQDELRTTLGTHTRRDNWLRCGKTWDFPKPVSLEAGYEVQNKKPERKIVQEG